jgi:hypothetical protein
MPEEPVSDIRSCDSRNGVTESNLFIDLQDLSTNKQASTVMFPDRRRLLFLFLRGLGAEVGKLAAILLSESVAWWLIIFDSADRQHLISSVRDCSTRDW